MTIKTEERKRPRGIEKMYKEAEKAGKSRKHEVLSNTEKRESKQAIKEFYEHRTY